MGCRSDEAKSGTSYPVGGWPAVIDLQLSQSADPSSLLTWSALSPLWRQGQGEDAVRYPVNWHARTRSSPSSVAPAGQTQRRHPDFFIARARPHQILRFPCSPALAIAAFSRTPVWSKAIGLSSLTPFPPLPPPFPVPSPDRHATTIRASPHPRSHPRSSHADVADRDRRQLRSLPPRCSLVATSKTPNVRDADRQQVD